MASICRKSRPRKSRPRKSQSQSRSRTAFAVMTVVAVLAGPSAALAQTATPCAGLAGRSIEPKLIGLANGTASVTSAAIERVAASPATPEPSVAYCKVLGEIAPRDPAAPPIRFEINLPESWNGKAVQYGGGGFNGVLITGLAPLRDARLDTPVPVARGFATWGTDSGHDNAKLAEIQAFALNDEALENFSFAAYKKVRDAAVEIARLHYGTAPRRVYFYGGSEGGREGLTMAQRFPADFDGIVSVVPVINWVGLQAAGARNGIAMMGAGWLSPAKVKTLHKAVMEACDGLDGLADGIVSRYASCTGAFDPQKLRCADGRDNETCLTDAQVAAVETIRTPYVFPFQLANGITSYPGYNYGGEDQPDGMVAWSSGPKPPVFPLPAPAEQSRIWFFGAGAVRYFLAGDANLDPRKFRPEDYKARIERISALMDSTDPDLSRFAARGGKLILKENMSDYAQSPFAGVEYYKSVVAKLGQGAVDSFMRFYVTPGASHSGTGVSSVDGAPLPRGVDLLEAIDAWADRGAAPDALVQVAQETKPPFVVTASRPMCRYPAWPRYKGEGPSKEAASFECVTDDG
jgi:tannase/feruloyl esterase